MSKNEFGDEVEDAAPAAAATNEFGDKIEAPEPAAPDRQRADADAMLAEPEPDLDKLPLEPLPLATQSATEDAAYNSWRCTQIGLDQDTAGKALELSRKYDINSTWASQNVKTLDAQSEQSDRAAILSTSPGLAALAKDPVKLSVVKDDMANAAWWERLVTGRFKIAVDPATGALTSDYTAPGIVRAIEAGADPEEAWLATKKMEGRATVDDVLRLQQLQRQKTDFGAANGFESAVYGAAEMLPFVGATVAAGAAATALGAPAAVVGAVAGATSTAIAMFQGVGPLHEKILQASANPEGVPQIDPDTAFNLAVGVGAAGAVGMSIAGPEMFGGIPGVKQAFGLTAEKAVAGAVAERTFGEAVGRFGKSLGGHWLTGVGVSMAQAALDESAAQFGRTTAGQDADPQAIMDAAIEAGKGAAGSMLILGLHQPTAEFSRDLGRLARIGEDTVRFDSLAASVKESKVPDEQIERVMYELRQRGIDTPASADDARTVFVNREKFEELAKEESGGVDPEKLAGAILGDNGAAYRLAKQSNSETLPVPIEKYASKMVRSGLHDKLAGDVKFTADGYTAREGLELQKKIQDYAKQTGPSAQELVAIRERETHKALEAGATPAQAKAHGRIAQAVVTRHGALTGLSPEAAYQELNFPSILGPGSAEEPLAAIPTPLPPPGAPRGPATETWAEHVARPENKPPLPPGESSPQHRLLVFNGDGSAKVELPFYVKHGTPESAATEMLQKLKSPLTGVALGPEGILAHSSDLPQDNPWRRSGATKVDRSAAVPGYGRQTTIRTPQKASGEPGRYRVVEADNLVQSHNPHTFGVNPEYPAGVQERDYLGTEGEQGKVAVGAGALKNDLLLTDTTSAVDGPPLVTEGERPVVLGGNGRTMMMKRGFEQNEAQRDAYKADLKAKAQQFGLDPAEIEKMKSPVLVREATGIKHDADVADLRAAGRRYNEALTQALSPRARGLAEGKALSPVTFAELGNLLSVNGDSSLREIMKSSPQAVLDILRRDGVLNGQNAAQFIQGGEITPEGKDRIETMFLGRVLDNEQRFAATAPGTLAKIERIAPALLRVAGTNPVLDEMPRVRAGLDLLNEAKASGHTIDQFLAQGSMFSAKPPPEVVSMAHMLEGRGQRDLASTFNKWASVAAVDPRQSTMFVAPPPTLEQARIILRQPALDLDGSTTRLFQPPVEDYQGEHRPPGPHKEDPPLYDLTRAGAFPKDIYGGRAAQYYGEGRGKMDADTISILQSLKDKPNEKVTIYRSVPADLGDAKISKGDWVTVNREYAEMHGERFESGSRIIEKTVNARDVFANGNSIHEQGYYPESKNILEQPAYHGTPHDVDQFKMEKIGTGEGAQVYGHGLYFAKDRGIAEHYRGKLSKTKVEPQSPRAAGENDAMKQGALLAFERYSADADRPQESLRDWQQSFDASVARAEEDASEARKQHEADPAETTAADVAVYDKNAKEARELSEWAKSLTLNDLKVSHGRLYQVDVPESDRLLDYDKPLSEQSPHVKTALEKIGITIENGKALMGGHLLGDADKVTGRNIQYSIDDRERRRAGGDREVAAKATSEILRGAGIPGLQYLDANSRGDGKGNHNFVIWDENEIRNLQKLKQEGVTPDQKEQIARGHLSILEGPGGKRYEIHLGPGADASTLAHETGHWLFDTLYDAASRPGAHPDLVRDMNALERFAGYKPGERAEGLDVKAEERVAHAWEQYLGEGIAPAEELKGVFGRFSRWMTKIYGSIVGVSDHFQKQYGESTGMNDEVRGIFDRMLASSDETEQMREAETPRAASGGAGGGEPPAGGPPPGGAGAPPPRAPRPVPRMTRAWARDTLRRQPLSSISDTFYLHAERKAAREAIDHASAGREQDARNADVTRAFAAALHDASKEILKEADKQFKTLRAIADPKTLTRMAKSAANDAGREYIDVAQSLLEAVGAKQAPAGDTSDRLGVGELTNRLAADGREAAFDVDGLRSLLAKPKPWSALTPDEAANAYLAARQIRTAANGANKVMVEGRRQELRDVVSGIGADSEHRPDQGLEPVTRSAKEGLVDKVLKSTGLYNADNLKPEEIWKRLGPTAFKLWETTIEGRNAAAKMKGEVLRNFMEKFEPILTNGKFGKLLRGELSPETLRDLGVPNGVMLDGSKMNVESLFMAFLNLGTKSSEERLLGGYKWDKGAVLRAIGKEVPKELLDMGQEIMRFSEEKMWPLIKAHAEGLTGVAPPKLDKQPIVVRHADGTATSYDGGYFAAKYNADASRFARERVGADSIDSLDRGARASVMASFTKARADRYTDVIDLNWSNYPNHMSSVMHYLAYDEPVRSIGAVLRDRQFREIATRRVGAEQLKQLDESIKTIARGTSQDPAAAASYTSSLISGILRSRPISNAIGFSFGVAAQQIPSHTAYAIASGKISAKNGTAALGRAVMPENWNQALAKSTELQYRADHYSEMFREALSGHSDITNGWKQKADTAAFAMMDGADRVLSHVIWDAAYRDALDGRKLFDGSIAGNDAAAVEHANRTLRELMPTHNRLEMASVVRNPGALGALQLFRGLKNVVWNVESNAIDKAIVASKESPLATKVAHFGLAAAKIMGSAVVLHLLGKFWGGHGKNDDDGEGLQGWATWAERGAMSALVSLNMPFGGEMAEGTADHLARGESLAESLKAGAKELRPAPAMATLQDSVKRLGVMVDDDAETSERVGAATQLLLSNLGGYANQAGKTFGYLRDVANGDQQPRGPLDLTSGVLYGSPGEKNTKTPLTGASDLLNGEQ